jgi:nucleotide-binding universal stress UspA family protein
MARLLLCGVNGDDDGRDVVSTARGLARRAGLDLLFVHVAPMVVPAPTAHGFLPGEAGASMAIPPGGADELRSRALRAGAALLDGLGIREDESRVVVGEAVSELCRVAEEREPALIVVGSQGRGALAGAMLGSVSRALVLEGRWPVMIAPAAATAGATAGATGDGVVCGIEEPVEAARVVARTAAGLASALGGRLVLTHVVADGSEAAAAGPAGAQVHLPALDDEDRAPSGLLETVLDAVDAEVDVELVLAGGGAAAGITAVADELDAQAVVVGCRGAGALRSALEGSVSLELVRAARRPVVVVPPALAFA